MMINLRLLLIALLLLLPALAMAASQSPPDERLLWNMLHNNKLQLLQQAIESWKVEYPGWQPPADMVNAIRAKEAEMKAKRSQSKSESKPVVAEQPKPNLCQNLEGITTTLPATEAERLIQLQTVLADCRTAAERTALLEIAQPHLQPQPFDALLKSVANPEGIALNDIEYRQHRYWLTQWIKSDDIGAFETLLLHMGSAIEQHQDAEMAGVIAWYQFNNEDHTEAINWFTKARQWQPENHEMIYGLTLALYKVGRLSEAQPLAERYQQEIPKLRPLLGEIVMEQGWRQYAQSNYRESLDSGRASQSLLESPQQAELLMAWSWYQLGDLVQSRALAAPHQQQSPQARQLLALIQQREQQQQQEQAAASAVVVAVSESDELYSRKQFLAANAVGGGRLLVIETPSLETGLIWRHKSGAAGTSQLDIYHLPLFAGHYIHNSVHEFSVTALRTTLRSGASDTAGDLVGSAVTPTVAPVNELDNGISYRFDYQKSGWHSPSLSLGLTPSNGAVDSALTYELGFKEQIKQGYWRAGLYARPVRESVLSYTGMYDLNSNVSWGRVLKQGVEGEALYQWSDEWSSFVSAAFANLNGKGVADNQMYSLSVSVGRDLKLKRFSYFTVGPEIAWQHYDRNLSHYTLGHGGYFSPDSLLRIGMGVNVLTEEGARYLIKGRFAFGYQRHDEAAERKFPNTTDFDAALTSVSAALDYDSNSESGLVYDAEIKGVYLLTPRWQLSGGAVVRDSSGYSDFTVGVGARYYFDGRRVSYSSDIPEWMFNAVY
jgi:Flp pilus assembly protein TadD